MSDTWILIKQAQATGLCDLCGWKGQAKHDNPCNYWHGESLNYRKVQSGRHCALRRDERDRKIEETRPYKRLGG
ncbi:hypothetical protein [Desulfospira joergensenii]|uniref:hypothetical protein n=1 Tax=Desulfospira joergensenii TaxID=53329 RepID=UPI0003B656E2|nr:hypothetical protein [Desulfospira joergensenii]